MKNAMTSQKIYNKFGMRLPAFTILLLIGISLSWAADPISNPADQNAQQQIRQQQREKELRQQQETDADARSASISNQQSNVSETIPEQEAPCFAINQIRLIEVDGDNTKNITAGSSHFQFALDETLSAGELDKPILGRCLGVQGINAIMARVQNRIIVKGYVTTRVLVGPQDLKSGVLDLTVISGRINAIRLSSDANPHVSLWNALPMQAGDILNLRDIEQALENFKRIPTAEADIQIEPASQSDKNLPGLSDVVIKYQRKLPIRVALNFDDAGSRTTGRYQGGVTLSLDSITTLNDLFYINYNHDLGGGDSGKRGNDSTTAHYSLPWDYWTFGVTASKSYFHQQVAGVSQSYIFSGNSENLEGKINRLVFRNAINKTNLFVKTFMRRSGNYIDDVEINVQRRRTAGFEYGFNQSWFIGKATLDYMLSYRRGTGAYHSLKAPEQNFGEGTSRMKLWLADISFNYPFGINAPWGEQALQYSANLRGQSNNTPLTPQDRFGIGNRFGVRGFDGENILLGDNGWFIRNELIAPLKKSGQVLYLGLDYGEIGGQSAQYLIGKQLAGAVIGLRGSIPTSTGGFSYDVFLGQPLHKPKGYQTHESVAGFNFSYNY